MPDPCTICGTTTGHTSACPTGRREQIIVLLETRDDHLPQPAARRHVDPGFVHNAKARETCEDCLASGDTTAAKVGCETCGGRGWIEVVRTSDPYELEGTKPFGWDVRHHELAHDRDAELRRLAQQTAPLRATDADDLADTRPHQWEIDRQRKWADYDYRALDAALEELRQVDDGAYKLLHSVYVYGWLDHSAVVEAACARGLRFIDARMPATIRSPGMEQDADAVKESLWHGKSERHQARRAERVQRVIRAHFVWGWSTAEIAAHEVLSQRRVQQILSGAQGEQAAVASGPAA